MRTRELQLAVANLQSDLEELRAWRNIKAWLAQPAPGGRVLAVKDGALCAYQLPEHTTDLCALTPVAVAADVQTLDKRVP